MKRCFLLLSILAMFLSISCKEEIVEEEKGDSITKWIPAHTTFSQPLGEWERIQYCFKHEEEVRRRPLQRVYPAYYGGAQALPGDKTKYVIYLTDTSEVVKQDFVRLCDLVPENCVFRKCERSVNELHALIEEILTSSSLSETGLIESCGVDEEAGMVRVTLAEDLDATQQAGSWSPSLAPNWCGLLTIPSIFKKSWISLTMLRKILNSSRLCRIQSIK